MSRSALAATMLASCVASLPALATAQGAASSGVVAATASPFATATPTAIPEVSLPSLAPELPDSKPSRVTPAPAPARPRATPIPIVVPSASAALGLPGVEAAGGVRVLRESTGYAKLAHPAGADDLPPANLDRLWLLNNVPNLVSFVAARDPATFRHRGATWDLPATDPLFVRRYRKMLPSGLTPEERSWIGGLALRATRVETLVITSDHTEFAPNYVVGTGCDPHDCKGHAIVIAFDDESSHFFAAYRVRGAWHPFGDDDFRCKEVALIVLARNVVDPHLRFPLADPDAERVATVLHDLTPALMGPDQERTIVPVPRHAIVP